MAWRPAGWTTSRRSTPSVVPTAGMPPICVSPPNGNLRSGDRAAAQDPNSPPLPFQEGPWPGIVGTDLTLELLRTQREVQAAVFLREQRRQRDEGLVLRRRA